MHSRALAAVVGSVLTLGFAAASMPAATAGNTPMSTSHGDLVTVHRGGHATLSHPAVGSCFSNFDDSGWSNVSQNFEPLYDAYDSTAADDFTLDQACTAWGIEVPGQYFNGTGPADSETVTFYVDDGSGESPGDVLSTQTVTGTDSAGSFDIPLSPVPLDAGVHYWVSVQVNMNDDPAGEWGWEASNTQAGSPAVWENPGDGFGTGCTTWTNMQSCLGGVGPDLEFSLIGSFDAPGTSEVFGGYVVSLGSGKAGSRHDASGTAVTTKAIDWTVIFNPPPNPCAGKPDGYIVSLVTTPYFGPKFYWPRIISVTTIVFCFGGQPHTSVYYTYWTWPTGRVSGTLLSDVPYGDRVKLTGKLLNGDLTLTATDMSTGASGRQIVKDAGVTEAGVGLTTLDPNGNYVRQGDFKKITLSGVKLNKTPIAQLDPTSTTLVDSNGNKLETHALGKNNIVFRQAR